MIREAAVIDLTELVGNELDADCCVFLFQPAMNGSDGGCGMHELVGALDLAVPLNAR